VTPQAITGEVNGKKNAKKNISTASQAGSTPSQQHTIYVKRRDTASNNRRKKKGEISQKKQHLQVKLGADCILLFHFSRELLTHFKCALQIPRQFLALDAETCAGCFGEEKLLLCCLRLVV